MVAKWIKHLDGLFCVTKKEASRSGQRLSLVCCFLFSLQPSFYSVSPSGQGLGRSRPGDLGEMGRSNAPTPVFQPLLFLQIPPPFILSDAECGEGVGDSPYRALNEIVQQGLC